MEYRSTLLLLYVVGQVVTMSVYGFRLFVLVAALAVVSLHANRSMQHFLLHTYHYH